MIGVIAFDAIAVAATRAGVSEDGAAAARNAASTWEQAQDVQLAYDVAAAAAAEQNGANSVDARSFRIEPDGTVELTIERTANTVLFHRLSATAPWARVSVGVAGRAAR